MSFIWSIRVKLHPGSFNISNYIVSLIQNTPQPSATSLYTQASFQAYSDPCLTFQELVIRYPRHDTDCRVLLDPQQTAQQTSFEDSEQYSAENVHHMMAVH